MSTTTYAPRLHASGRAARAVGRNDGTRRLGGLAEHAPTRASSGNVSGTFATTSPFTGLAPDGRRPRRVVTTTLATLAWVPVLALELVALTVVGVAAGVATVAVWCWRSVSPAQAARAGSRDTDLAPDEPEVPGPAATDIAPAHGRRLVRDRTLGYDA
ncbi:hypothetical protein H1Q78_05090 [Cellulosimicrobium cellulans]|uniref:hypothetical protein n=1 Tax=Cellulosimicrobium cellulans TaxID=1710 RepID=UPI001EDA4CDA|nr:hypothetical protein [Cellulosimicrobium cellulans]UKJ64767.1 hypothetical protein H1Q78_05090 [Cellulosimicrobium cellulans]